MVKLAVCLRYIVVGRLSRRRAVTAANVFTLRLQEETFRKLNFAREGIPEVRCDVLSVTDGLTDARNGRADGVNEQFGFNLRRWNSGVVLFA